MITIYTRVDPPCNWCIKSKELMNNLGMRYTELKLGVDFTKEELREKIGDHLPLTVPQIYIGAKRIGGYEDLVEYCESTGIMGLQE